MRKKQTFPSKILNLRLSKLMIISTCLFLSCNSGKTNQSQTKSILEANQNSYFNNIQVEPTTDQSTENAELSLQLPNENQQSLDDPQIIAQAYGGAFYLGKFGCHKSHSRGSITKRAVKHPFGQEIFGINCVNSNNQEAYGAPGEVPGAQRYDGASSTVDIVGSDCYKSENNQFQYDKKYYAIQPDKALSNEICFILERDLK